MKLQLSTLRSYRTPVYYSDYDLRYVLDFSEFSQFSQCYQSLAPLVFTNLSTYIWSKSGASETNLPG